MATLKDDKDWTWVVERACAQCGFDPTTIPRDHLSARVREVAPAFAARLSRPDAADRPQEDVWSPLEYGAHVRDVAGLMGGRLEQILTVDDPVFPNWDQDEVAEEVGYRTQDPLTVSEQIRSALEDFADAVDAVPEDGWERPGHRTNGDRFTARTLVVYSLHDFEHHVWDVTKA